MKFTLAYNLDNYGWADATIQNEGKKYSIDSISYLSDAFADMSEAILLILTGSDDTYCSFDHEPGRTKIRFLKKGENIEIRIFRFRNELKDEPWENGELVFETTIRRKRLKSQYLEEADKILKNIGPKSYKEKWGYEFPLEIYEKIKKS